MSREFFNSYFKFVGYNEAPNIFHRWVIISLVGALLARNVKLPFGHSFIYPNQFILLTGTPGTRKGTAINFASKLAQAVGYRYLAPDKAAKEALWDWMQDKLEESDFEDLDLDLETLDDYDSRIAQAYIAMDEFADFIGIGDDAFVTNLTKMWDNPAKYDNPKRKSENVYVPNPTINILSGMTPSGISEVFGSLAVGGGFFSRVLFIHSKPSGRKITFPSPPNMKLREGIIERLKEISLLEGEITLTKPVKDVLHELYNQCPSIPDRRFQYYEQRRFTHLLKLVLILSAMDLTLTPTVDHCIVANTILYAAERHMPDALGEYGRAKLSASANRIMEVLNMATQPMTAKELWKIISRDLNKMTELLDILTSLSEAERVQKVKMPNSVIAYLPNNAELAVWPANLLDPSVLTEEEHPDFLLDQEDSHEQCN